MAQGIDILSELNSRLNLKKVDIRTYSPLSLAYIGDSVYDLVIRSYVVSLGNTSSNNMHRMTVRYVSAPAQAKIIDGLLSRLTDEEITVYKRGKNSKPHTMAKNATQSEYLKATGFEALIGFLYLSEKGERLMDLVKMGIDIIEKKDEVMC